MKAIQTRLGGLRVWDSIRVLAVARRAGVRGVPLRYYYALYIVPDKKKQLQYSEKRRNKLNKFMCFWYYFK